MPTPEAFMSLPVKDRVEILAQGETALRRPAQLLEKDVWICWALDAVFRIPHGPAMAFKGGTSLSKVFQAIDRFSEDIDITLDYQYFGDVTDPLAPGTSRTLIDGFSDRVRKDYLPGFLRAKVRPHLEQVAAELASADVSPVQIGVSGDGGTLEIGYPRTVDLSRSYVRDRVLIEFGARNVVRPSLRRTIRPYLTELTIDVPIAFPLATVDVLIPERTFWEKITLAHAENTRSTKHELPPRFARHWYDLHMLAKHPVIGPSALTADRERDGVIDLKSVLFRQGGVDYTACSTGRLRLVPKEPMRSALRVDYDEMLASGMVEGEPPIFSALMDSIQVLEARINDRRRSNPRWS